MVSDLNGQARFSTLPVGQYAIEVTAPGYRTFQQEVVIPATREAQNVVVSMVPAPSTRMLKASPSPFPRKP